VVRGCCRVSSRRHAATPRCHAATPPRRANATPRRCHAGAAAVAVVAAAAAAWRDAEPRGAVWRARDQPAALRFSLGLSRSAARSLARFIPPDYCCAQRPCHQPARVVVVVLTVVLTVVVVVVVVAVAVVVVVVVVWLACRPTSTL